MAAELAVASFQQWSARSAGWLCRRNRHFALVSDLALHKYILNSRATCQSMRRSPVHGFDGLVSADRLISSAAIPTEHNCCWLDQFFQRQHVIFHTAWSVHHMLSMDLRIRVRHADPNPALFFSPPPRTIGPAQTAPCAIVCCLWRCPPRQASSQFADASNCCANRMNARSPGVHSISHSSLSSGVSPVTSPACSNHAAPSAERRTAAPVGDAAAAPPASFAQHTRAGWHAIHHELHA